MGTKTLLQIVQQVAGELSLPVPTAVLSSSNGQTQQLKALVVAACDELCDMHDWHALVSTGQLVRWFDEPPNPGGGLVPGQAAYRLPPDCLRIQPDTVWDDTNKKFVFGKLTPKQWAGKGSAVATADRYFIVNGRSIVLYPTPTTHDNVYYNYVSNWYVWDVGLAQRKAEFTLDSDTTVFHDRLVMNFAKLKFMEEQGFDTTAAVSNFNQSLGAALAGDTPAPDLRLSRPSSDLHLLDRTNLPNGNWGI